MKKLFCVLSVLVLSSMALSAQSDSSAFRVISFRKLDWDLDARSNCPMTDQNGRKAALIKVVTTENGFDFDVGMMGIVGIRQEIGEIWVYVPEKVRKITIRHKDFGIIRDYGLGSPLESASVYELVLGSPRPAPESTIVVRDSIIYIPATPETAKKERKPLGISILATACIPDSAFGAMALRCGESFGGYVKFRSNFESAACDYDCSPDGTTETGYIWTSGKSRVSKIILSAGGVLRCGGHLYACAGAGYGRRLLLWEDSAGGWAKVEGSSHSGLSTEIGALMRLGRLAVYTGVCTIGFKYLDAEIGLGLNF